MNTYTLTIVATFEAEDETDAVDAFAEWITDPRNLVEGVTIEQVPE